MGQLRPFALDKTDVDFLLAQISFASIQVVGYDLVTGQALYGYVSTDGENNAPAGGTLYGMGQSYSTTVGGDAAYLFTTIHNGSITLLNGTGTGDIVYSGSPTPGTLPTGPDYNNALDYRGLRIASGAYNNLDPGHQGWGAAQTPFLRFVPADYTHYTKQVTVGANVAAGGALSNADHAALVHQFGSLADAVATHGDYAVTPVTTNGVVTGYQMQDVIDYTPRMISQTIATADALKRSGAGAITQSITYTNDAWRTAEYVHNGVTYTSATAPDETYLPAVNSVAGNAPYSGVFVMFGQFFDHGLDFISKDSGHTITIPLAVTDPLYRAPTATDPGVTSMVVSRADPSGFDASGNPVYTNHDSPYIDQSQTYGSNDQITLLLRDWVQDPNTGEWMPGAKLFDGNQVKSYIKASADGTGDANYSNDADRALFDPTHDKVGSYGVITTTATVPTLNELRAELLATKRDDLTWDDINNFRVRDAKGHVLLGNDGKAIGIDEALLLDKNPHFDVYKDASGTVVNPAGHIDLSNPIFAAALTDGTIVYDATTHSIVGGSIFGDINFADFTIIPTDETSEAWKVTNEFLLQAVGDHYIAGDGRANENFGLTAFHHVFHEEHNFQVDNLEQTIEEELKHDPSKLAGKAWQEAVTAANGATLAAGVSIVSGHYEDAFGNYTLADGTISWNQDEVFKGAQLIVTMEYQHVAIDQYARKVTPDLPPFVTYDAGLNSNITLEYAESAFRFGHSQLRETIDAIDPTGGITGKIVRYALEDAFLNPAQFANVGAGAIFSGSSEQVGNETDEFVTPALQQTLLGQPLDLAAINIARGRDVGIPTLNATRKAIFDTLQSGATISNTISAGELAPYTSWADFGAHLQHPGSLVNFIAAYAFDGDLTKAYAALSDPMFMNGGDKSFNNIDLWIGGLAELHSYGGILGTTFNALFVDQMERLQDGDRFYYFYRLDAALLQTTNLNNEVINEQFKNIVERNTGARNLGGDIMSYTDSQIELAATPANVLNSKGATISYQDQHKYGDVLATNPGVGIYSGYGTTTAGNGAIISFGGNSYVLDNRPDNGGGGVPNLDGTPSSGYNSHEVIVGSSNNDYIDAGNGDDTSYGGDGNDILLGGPGADHLYGGNGNDTLYGGDNEDFLDGGAGNDVIYGGTSGGVTDIIIGGDGNDILYGDTGIDNLYGGTGNDYLYGGGDTDVLEGEAGNDVLSGGDGPDALNGGEGDDILYGGPGDDALNGQQGDDILLGGLAIAGNNGDVLDGGASVGWGTGGFNLAGYYDLTTNLNITIDLNQQGINLAGALGATYIDLQGAIGSQFADKVLGDVNDNWIIGGSGADTLSGGGGHDVIVGGSIKLADLNALTTSLGFLTGGAATHFNDLQSTRPDFVLGDGGTNGVDTVVFRGARANYTIAVIPATATTPLAIEVIDNTGVDGTQLLVGVGQLQFTDALIKLALPAAATVQLLSDTGVSNTDNITKVGALKGTADPFTKTLTVSIDNGAPIVIPVASDGTWSLSPTLADGKHSVVLTETSYFGSVVTSAPFIFTLDTQAPAAPILAAVSYVASATALTSYTLTGNAEANSLVALLNGAISLGTVSAGAGGTWSFTVTPAVGTGFSALITAAETDLAGNTSSGPQLGVLVGGAGNDVIAATGAYAGVADLIIGLGGNDTLTGGTGADTLDGGAGNDTLTGGVNAAGVDTLVGGAGNDTYVVSNAGDILVELAGGGTDAVRTALASFTLGANLENLTYTGATAFQGTGNALANTIQGGAGADTLDGGVNTGGAVDRLVGLGGDDTYIVRNLGDVVAENGNSGTDTVLATINSYTLGANVENLRFIGTGDFTGVGNTLANTITGGDGADRLNGGNGNDTLIGGAGADTLTGGLGADNFILARGDANGDLITDFTRAGGTADQITLSGYGLGASLGNFGFAGGQTTYKVLVGNAVVDTFKLTGNITLATTNYHFA